MYLICFLSPVLGTELLKSLEFPKWWKCLWSFTGAPLEQLVYAERGPRVGSPDSLKMGGSPERPKEERAGLSVPPTRFREKGLWFDSIKNLGQGGLMSIRVDEASAPLEGVILDPTCVPLHRAVVLYLLYQTGKPKSMWPQLSESL